MTAQPNVWHAEFGMAWGVKDSFVSYIQRSSDGQITVNDGAGVTSEGQFYFPLRDMQEDAEQIIFQFGGEVNFQAHFGFLAIALQAPRISIRGSKANLELADSEGSWLTLAEANLSMDNRDSSSRIWHSGRVALAEAGVELFGETYPHGEVLSPLVIRTPATSHAVVIS